MPAEATTREPRFWGTHDHTLDQKGRVILPARFREPFREGAFVDVANGPCLGVWTPEGFERRTDAMLALRRQGQSGADIARAWAASTFDVTPDSQGRIPIPPRLRSLADLTGDLVINGAIDHVEIWNAARWQEVEHKGSEDFLSSADALAEAGF